MTITPGTDIQFSAGPVKPRSTRAKRLTQMAGAAVISLGMVGTFSIPAYAAAPDDGSLPDGFTDPSAVVQNQTLETSDATDAASVLSETKSGLSEEAKEEAAARKAAKAAEAAEKANASESDSSDSDDATSAPSPVAVGNGVAIHGGWGGTTRLGPVAPGGETGLTVVRFSSVSGADIVSAALAQLGDMQDCTALVERSLRAAGVNGVGDLGTQVGEYTALGGKVVTDLKPGDVLVFPGQHVAIYKG